MAEAKSEQEAKSTAEVTPTVRIQDVVNDIGEIELGTLAEFVFGHEMAEYLILNHPAFCGAYDQMAGLMRDDIAYVYQIVCDGFKRHDPKTTNARMTWLSFWNEEERSERLIKLCNTKKALHDIRQSIQALNGRMIRLDPNILKAKQLLTESVRTLEKSIE